MAAVATQHETVRRPAKCCYEFRQRQLIDRWPTILMLVLLASLMLSWHEAEANSVHRRFYRRAVRLCSKNLSDALYLICKDRGGYNEPFSNSGEADAGRHTTGPGLVEECCYNACSLEQMEQYCKPLPKSGWSLPDGCRFLLPICKQQQPPAIVTRRAFILLLAVSTSRFLISRKLFFLFCFIYERRDWIACLTKCCFFLFYRLPRDRQTKREREIEREREAKLPIIFCLFIIERYTKEDAVTKIIYTR